MPTPRVFNCAFLHQTDIDPEFQVDAEKLDLLGKTCMARAKEALTHDCRAYNELQRFIISDVMSSIASTHQTIRKMLGGKFERPESVDALVLTRLQIEGLYVVCLMLEDSKWVDTYLQDAWKKLYTYVLLQREETKNFKRFDEFNQNIAPAMVEGLRKLHGITEAQQLTLECEELGVPLPQGVTSSQIPRFPTPGRIVGIVAVTERKKMLERLYPEYVNLSSFAHGLPQANLFKGMFGSRTLHSQLFSEAKLKDSFQTDVVEQSFLLSFLSIIQSAAELTTLYPSNVELCAAVTDAWKFVSTGTLLGKGIWEIRTRRLLRVIA